MCGVFGVFGSEDSAKLTNLGLHALQHRGQEAAGITVYDKGEKDYHTEKGLGLVADIFGAEQVMERLRGTSAIGHTRYSTTKKENGERTLRNVQPFYAKIASGEFALAHNGNITNYAELQTACINKGCIFQSSSDTEVIQHLMARASGTTLERVVDALKAVNGAYSLVLLTERELIGIRDPFGFRPLVIGRKGDTTILSSETCALDIIDAQYVRDVVPGEVVVISSLGIRSSFPFEKKPQKFCIFEHVYFSKPESVFDNINAYEARVRIGHCLATQAPATADFVVPVPDSGTPAAIGYSEKSGIPFHLGILRNHYVGRTFIEPIERVRNLGVKLKLNPNKHFLKGKKIVLVDDSLVRGTTIIKLMEMLRYAEVKEVHLRIASPPVFRPCFWGIDTPTQGELLTSKVEVNNMAKRLGVDSLAFVSVEGLHESVSNSFHQEKSYKFCDFCFTGENPEKCK